LQIPDASPVVFEGPSAKGHANLYGAPPGVLLGYVTKVFHYSDVTPAER
jgi:hypothetical protein